MAFLDPRPSMLGKRRALSRLIAAREDDQYDPPHEAQSKLPWQLEHRNENNYLYVRSRASGDDNRLLTVGSAASNPASIRAVFALRPAMPYFAGAGGDRKTTASGSIDPADAANPDVAVTLR